MMSSENQKKSRTPGHQVRPCRSVGRECDRHGPERQMPPQNKYTEGTAAGEASNRLP